MSELDERLRTLDRLTPPDLWPEVLEREPRKPPSDTWRRLAVATLAIAVAAAGVGVAWWAVGRHQPRPLDRPPPMAPRANGLIAFLAGRLPGSPFGSTSIYVMQPDGTEIKQLIKDGGDQSLAWSPDGTQIAFIRTYGEFPPDDLYVMDADGGNVRQLTHVDQYQVGVSWSPDGAWLVVGRGGANRDYDLWLVRADGSGERQLTSGPGNDIGPLWSPDGADIAFSASRSSNGGPTGVFVMHADGTAIRQLTPYGNDDRAVAWSPDGQQILVLRRDTILVAMGRDGTDPRQVYGCSGSCQILSAAWSPDGRLLLASVVISGDNDQSTWGLVEMNSDGSNPHAFPTGDLSVCCASWQSLLATTST
jgi:dipeptidyl aminopeptidase/acylaminoacyl peptidase